MSENEAWFTTDNTRYCPGEQVGAVLHMEGSFIGTNIRALLTGPDGKTETLEPTRAERDVCHLHFQAGASGAYTLVCVIEDDSLANQKSNSLSVVENTKLQYVCSTCFFVGDCEAAIPKVPNEPFLFVPEMWEEPDYYKLVSLYLKNDEKPVPNVPVTLIFRNKSGRLEKELRTDGTGNVFFAPYMAGTYCLVGKTSSEDSSDGKTAGAVTTTLSFTLPERKGQRRRAKEQVYYGF